MERKTAYNDFIVRVPYGEDASRLYSFTQSMGWGVIVSLNHKETPTNAGSHKDIAS